MAGIKCRIRLLLLALISACLPSVAQVGDLRNNLAVGFNGGMNLNNVTTIPKIKQSTMKDFSGGITIRYISEKYMALLCGIQAEVNYTKRGWKELIEDDTGDTYSRNMNYIEVPVLTHWGFGKEKRVMVFLNLGPQVAYLLNEKENMSDPWHPAYRAVNEQYDKAVDKKFDYGIVGGGGLEVRTKVGSFLIEGRYYYALSDFYNITKKDFFNRAAHTTIVGKMTYLFNVTK